MENLVPLGTGNSRLMKSNIPASTTLAQLIQMLNNGTFPYDIGPLNPAGISQQGTPLNKATLFSDQTMAKYPSGIEDPNDAFEKLASATLYHSVGKYTEHTGIGGMPVGSSVFLNVGGTPTEFIVVNQGIPSESSLYDASCDGTWLLMKDCYEKRQWNSSNVNDYANSDIHSYLNSTFLNLFDSEVQAAVKQVKIPYVNGTGNAAVASGANGLSCKIFLLSGYEVGWTTSDLYLFPQDGAKLSYFKAGTGGSANSKRIAYLDSSATNWWLRSPSADGSNLVLGVNSSGNYSNGDYCTKPFGIRPALVLPSDYSYTYYTDEDGNIYTEQEYEQAITDINGNSLLTLPGTQVYTGSYTGTGTYGSSNPNTLTFPFEPKILVVGNYWQFTAPYGCPSAPCMGSGNSVGGVNLNWSGNSVSWYSTRSDTLQLNESGKTYNYFAIG